jgi:hypothetical protein
MATQILTIVLAWVITSVIAQILNWAFNPPAYKPRQETTPNELSDPNFLNMLQRQEQGIKNRIAHEHQTTKGISQGGA